MDFEKEKLNKRKDDYLKLNINIVSDTIKDSIINETYQNRTTYLDELSSISLLVYSKAKKLND